MLLDGQTKASELLDAAEHIALVGGAEAECYAAVACTACATNAVDVGLGHIGEIIVDDEWELVDVDAAGCNVGGHDDACGSAAEVEQGTLPCILALVAVDSFATDALLLEFAGYLVGSVFGAGEDECLLVAALSKEVG